MSVLHTQEVQRESTFILRLFLFFIDLHSPRLDLHGHTIDDSENDVRSITALPQPDGRAIVQSI